MKFLNSLKRAWKACVAHPIYLVFAVVLDLSHMVSFTWVLQETYLQIATALEQMQQLMQQVDLPTGDLLNDAAFTALEQQQEALTAQFSTIFWWVFVLFVAGYGLWVAFQGGAWWIAHKVVRENRGQAFTYRYFVPRFVGITLLAEGMLVIALYLLGKLSRIGPVQVDANLMAIATTIMVFLIFYWQVLAYAVIGKRRFWQSLQKVAWTRFGTMLPAYMLILVALGVFNALAYGAMQIDFLLGTLVSLLVAAPGYTFMRVYLIYMTNTR